MYRVGFKQIGVHGTVFAQRCFSIFLQVRHAIDVIVETRPSVIAALHDVLPDRSDVESRPARRVSVLS